MSRPEPIPTDTAPVKPGPFRRLAEDLSFLGALVRDARTGAYRRTPWWAIAAIALAFAYVLFPLDAIPDFVPAVGHLDDTIVVAICMKLLEQELADYRAWKEAQKPAPGA
jgi:uncharacterized membrane protein YkvA (DUF1232 family)